MRCLSLCLVASKATHLTLHARAHAPICLQIVSSPEKLQGKISNMRQTVQNDRQGVLPFCLLKGCVRVCRL